MVKGAAQVSAMFRRKGAAVIAAARSAAQQGGDDVAGAMRYLVPTDERDLQRSIRVEQADSIRTRKGGEADFIGVVVKAGDNTTVVSNSRGRKFQNARIQEFGTKSRPANPFFYPAWRMRRRSIRGKITSAIRRAWLT